MQDTGERGVVEGPDMVEVGAGKAPSTGTTEASMSSEHLQAFRDERFRFGLIPEVPPPRGLE